MKVQIGLANDTSDCYRIISTRGRILVGYLRAEADPYRWVLVDHISGHDVGITYSDRNHAKQNARAYFAEREFCFEGCGRLAVLPNETCRNCLSTAVAS